MKKSTFFVPAAGILLLMSMVSSCMLLEGIDFSEPYEPPKPQVVAAPPPVVQPIPEPEVIPQTDQENWNTSAGQWRGEIGRSFTLEFPPGGSPGSIWGTDIYTDDTSIGTAAVHAGLISFESGGTVVIEIIEGRSSYEGSERNNVSSASYGNWPGSFFFPAVGYPEEMAQVQQEDIPPDPDLEALQLGWGTTARSWRGEIGLTYTLELPPGGSPGSIWGTDIYTDDTSIGTAAVHAGLLTFESGGTVTIEITEGQSSYEGTERNGISSSSFGSRPGSFFFPAVGYAPKQPDEPEVPAEVSEQIEGSWSSSAQQWRGEIGKVIDITLSPGGSPGSIWGTDIYTDDTSIGTAAVHAGLITFESGGTVTIEITEGQSSYVGSERNNVSSASYGNWHGSFFFPAVGQAPKQPDEPEVPAEVSEHIEGSWSSSAQQWRGEIGKVIAVTIPPGGSPGSIWGTDIYTDDTSIGTAAVHAGLISFESGGTVVIEIIEGQSSYEGSERNNVSSASYGNWHGSFTFVGAEK